MKITEFEIGKKYRLSSDHDGFVEVNKYGYFTDSCGQPFYVCIDYINKDDWIELKVPIDYGTEENHKLFLLQGESESFWAEGYYFDENHITCIFHTEIIIRKKDVIKVIDLPSKELTHE